MGQKVVKSDTLIAVGDASSFVSERITIAPVTMTHPFVQIVPGMMARVPDRAWLKNGN